MKLNKSKLKLEKKTRPDGTSYQRWVNPTRGRTPKPPPTRPRQTVPRKTPPVPPTRLPRVPYVWPENPETRSFESKRGRVVAQISGKDTDNPSVPHVVQAWLDTPGEGTVAFMQVLVHSDAYLPEVGEHLMMCDIETRVDVRGQGFARELRESVVKETGLELYSSGGMTPEGFAAFGAHVQQLPNPYATRFDEPSVRYSSMGFVASWRHKVPCNAHRDIDYTEGQRNAMWELAESDVFRKMRDGEILWVGPEE